MKELKEIYDTISYLRKKGMKMKEMAGRVDYPQSVFSALYTTVIPAYIKNTEKGMDNMEALDSALVWVNNVSKKKLLETIPYVLSVLKSIDTEPELPDNGRNIPFIAAFSHNAQHATKLIGDHCGIYMSYSMSSGQHAMKTEPYLIRIADNGNYVEVLHNNAYGGTHRGIAIMNGASHLYIVFNETRDPQLAFFNICLRLPMYDKPPFLRGIYTCLDYNQNPVARRILFVKLSDITAHEDFISMRGGLKPFADIDDDERPYFEYTCLQDDIVRMCDIPAPTMGLSDLVQEKEILRLRGRDCMPGKKH